MIIAEPMKWKNFINDNGKMAKFQKKPFPLLEDCTSLYVGSVAIGDLNFTSTKHLQLAPAAAPLAPAAAPLAPAAPVAPAALSDSTNPFASLDGLDVSSAQNEAQSAPSNQESVQGASGGKKRKQSHIGSTIEDFVQYKKMQTSKTMEALNEKKKQDEEFSIHKCLDEVDTMDGLTDVEKSYAMDIFKTEIDREVFMKMKNKSVRFIWLKHQIRALGGSNGESDEKCFTSCSAYVRSLWKGVLFSNTTHEKELNHNLFFDYMSWISRWRSSVIW